MSTEKYRLGEISDRLSNLCENYYFSCIRIRTGIAGEDPGFFSSARVIFSRIRKDAEIHLPKINGILLPPYLEAMLSVDGITERNIGSILSYIDETIMGLSKYEFFGQKAIDCRVAERQIEIFRSIGREARKREIQ